MNMRNVLERLLMFIVGVPLVLVLPIFTQFNFLLLFLVYSGVMAVATYEIHSIVQKKYCVYQLSVFLCILVFNCATIYFFTIKKMPLFFYSSLFIIPFFVLAFLQLLVSQQKGFEKSFESIVANIFILVYPILLGNFFLFIAGQKNPQTLFTVLFVIVFSSDSLAWFFGMLFGNNNRGVIAASPKKSVAGFVGVGVSVFALSFIISYFLPQYFKNLLTTFIIVAGTSFASIIGDLFESIIKRSMSIKDSGTIILGRGGILDTIDSFLFAAPCYFFLSSVLL